MTQSFDLLRRFVREEDGVTAIEYGLLAALVGVAIITASALLGTKLGTLFTAIADKLGGVTVP
jgi:pilus assembly protein Flp/PilA